MIYYSYEDFKVDTRTLIDAAQPFGADAIVAIARGGLALALGMAQGLGIRNVQTLRAELYDHDSKRAKIQIFGDCDLNSCTKVLVVDDIADSGETLRAVLQRLQQQHPHIEFKSATLFYKTGAVIQPDHAVREATEWIEFFWERDFL